MTELVMKLPAFWRQGLGGLRSVYGLILLIPTAVLILDPTELLPILTVAGEALLGTLPYIVAAVLLFAYLRASGAEAVIARAFEGRESRMILFAALFGGLAPFCSCEVIPFIAGLLAVGAPLSAVMAFWLSSPLIDPPTLFITASALGWSFAIGKAIGAVTLGLFGGFATRFLIHRGLFADPLRQRSQGGCCSAPSTFTSEPLWRFWQERARLDAFGREALANGIFLLKWLAFAYLLQGLLVTYVPAHVIGSMVGGDGLLPIVIAALVGAPAYLNSYAAPPLVAGLMTQGMSAGAGMAFMMAGAVSCIPAMAAVWSLVRPTVFASYVALGIGGAILVGLAFGLIV
ncbi:MAG: permease [Alphaproteobacteria bacterium]|nr:permease [Alphaproteobacteria bacterium]